MKNNKSYGSLSINEIKVKIANKSYCWNSLQSLIPAVKDEDKILHSPLVEMLKNKTCFIPGHIQLKCLTLQNIFLNPPKYFSSYKKKQYIKKTGIYQDI